MTTERPARSSVTALSDAYWKLRIYADPSVFHGCEDEEEDHVRKPSRRLFEDFHAGRSTLVTSPLIARALQTAPETVRAWLRNVPRENVEAVEVSNVAETLADAYLAAQALAPEQRGDALHIAVASIADVVALATWKHEELESRRRVRAINEVNERLGYPKTDIRDPGLIAEGDDDSPNAKEFDCVKWTRKIRNQMYEETKHMSREEYRQWLRRRPTDPWLAAMHDRAIDPREAARRAAAVRAGE